MGGKGRETVLGERIFNFFSFIFGWADVISPTYKRPPFIGGGFSPTLSLNLT